MPPGSGGGLERLQLTIGFIAARFRALVGIIAIHIFTDILSKADLSILLRNHFTGTVKSIVTPYRIVIILLKDLLLQQYILQHLDLMILPQESLIIKGIVLSYLYTARRVGGQAEPIIIPPLTLYFSLILSIQYNI